MSDAERWAANQKFLDRLIARGDNVRLTIPKSSVRKGSILEQEIEYLIKRGYEVSPDGIWLIKK